MTGKYVRYEVDNKVEILLFSDAFDKEGKI